MLEDLKKDLPKYALPQFVRVVKALPVTGTFKYQKNVVKRVGFDLKEMDEDDVCYVLKRNQSEYQKLTEDVLSQIQAKNYF